MVVSFQMVSNSSFINHRTTRRYIAYRWQRRDPQEQDDMAFVADKVARWQVFLLALRFPLPILIPPMLHTHLSSGADATGTSEAAAPRDSEKNDLITPCRPSWEATSRSPHKILSLDRILSQLNLVRILTNYVRYTLMLSCNWYVIKW
jgi:hypothetical protein